LQVYSGLFAALEAINAQSPIDGPDCGPSYSSDADSVSDCVLRFDFRGRPCVLANQLGRMGERNRVASRRRLVMAALAAVAGLTDVMGDAQIRNLRDAWLHAGGNVVVVLIELYNWYSRYQHGGDAIIPTGLILSLIVVLILLFTGWKGWEMVYRYRVGVSDI
jgi:hypothetical protein